MAFVPLEPIGSGLQECLDTSTRSRNQRSHESLEAVLRARRQQIAAGWGEKYRQRVHDKGKLTARERIERLVDEGTQVFEVGTFVNFGVQFEGGLTSPAAGVVTAFAQVESRWCVLIANENTVASGSWWPNTPEKIQRAQEVALRLRLPIIYLVDCSGLFLPEQAQTFAGARGAGHIFKKNSELAAAGVPQLAGVFGDCIAGGGYMPIISDRVYMTEQAYMVIAGAALIKGAKSQALTSLEIGGAEVHVHQSGCADYRVPNDETLLRCLRREVARLPSSAVPFHRRGDTPAEPRFATHEIRSIVPADARENYDVMQVIARLCDLSLFWEIQAKLGQEVICGVGRIGGLFTGIIANRLGLLDHPDDPSKKRPGGSLYREGIAKMAVFCRACNDDGIPLIWLQDVAGFDIGREAERQGLLGFGSSLIYSNSTQQAPVFTVLLRRASGAGYYAMHGLPYDPVLQLSTPLTRQAVMEGKTLAIARYHSKLNDQFEIESKDPAERAQIEAGMAAIEQKIEADMDPYLAASRMDTDELVSLGELRSWLSVLLEMSYQSTGTRRSKNPRIWSLHDWAALDRGASRAATGSSPVAKPNRRSSARAPARVDLAPGQVLVRAPSAGRLYLRPSPDAGPFVQLGERVEQGDPIALIEVMKTFNRLLYGGDDLPAVGILCKILCEDNAEVEAGTPLFVLEPARSPQLGPSSS